MLLTPPEAAERLRVSLRMVYALMADGSLVAVKIRRAKRIDEHELQRFIESCQFASTKRRKGGAGLGPQDCAEHEAVCAPLPGSAGVGAGVYF